MPIIPIQDQVRASRIFENLTIQLNDLKKAAEYDVHYKKHIVEDDPHETYLSSEEDGSMSTDESIEDVDETYVELEAESCSSKSPSLRRSSVEDTARAIIVRSVGKPHLVSIGSPSSPSTMPEIPSRSTSRRPQPLRLHSLPRTSSLAARSPSTGSLPTYAHTPSNALPMRPETSPERSNARMTSPAIATAASPSNLEFTDAFPQRTSSIPAFPASEASEIQVASPTSTIGAYDKLMEYETIASTKKPVDRLKSGMGRMANARKKSMDLLSNAFLSTSNSLSTLSTPTENKRSTLPMNAAMPKSTSEAKSSRNRLSLNFSNLSLTALPQNATTPTVVTDVTHSSSGEKKLYQEVMTNVEQNSPDQNTLLPDANEGPRPLTQFPARGAGMTRSSTTGVLTDIYARNTTGSKSMRLKMGFGAAMRKMRVEASSNAYSSPITASRPISGLRAGGMEALGVYTR